MDKAQRFITVWRKPAPDILDWDFYTLATPTRPTD